MSAIEPGTARTRRGTPCQSPAVAGKTRCRMHGGAAGSGAPKKGRRNGKYRHGGFTIEAIDERRRLAALIRDSRFPVAAAVTQAAQESCTPRSPSSILIFDYHFISL